MRHSIEWMQGGVLSALLLAILLIPAFKNFFIEKGCLIDQVLRFG